MKKTAFDQNRDHVPLKERTWVINTAYWGKHMFEKWIVSKRNIIIEFIIEMLENMSIFNGKHLRIIQKKPEWSLTEMTNGRLSSKNSYQNSISTFQFILHGSMDEHSIWYLLLCYLERSMLFTLIFSRVYRFPANEKKKKKKISLRAQKKTSDIC